MIFSAIVILPSNLPEKSGYKSFIKTFDVVDDFEMNEKVDVVVRPEDVFLVDEGKGQVDGVITSSIFKGVHYEMIIEGYDFQWIVHSTKAASRTLLSIFTITE